MTALPSALPPVAFITWPTKKPVTLSSPALSRSQSSGLAAMTWSTTGSRAPCPWPRTRAALAMAAGSPPLGQHARPAPPWPGSRVARRRPPWRTSAAKAAGSSDAAPSSGRHLVGGAVEGAAAASAPARDGGEHQRVEVACRRRAASAGATPDGRRPAARGARPAARGSDSRTASLPLRRRARAAPGRARGSSGSRRPPPSTRIERGAAARPRPSGGSPARPARRPRAGRSGGAASYSMARPSERSELRFLISQRVPSSASPTAAHRHVGVDAQRALLHLAVGRAGGHEDGAQLAHVGRASSAERMSGRLTISTSGTPARL